MSQRKLLDSLSAGFRSGRRLLGLERKAGIYYVVPEVGWSTDWDGHYITQGIRDQFDVRAELTSHPKRLQGQVVHYGSLWEFLGHLGGRQNRHNRIVATVFHGKRKDSKQRFVQGLDEFLEHQEVFERLVTSNHIMRQRFIDWGVPEEKIACIPLGVDLGLFRPASGTERRAVRQRLGIPADAFCIGSFHKDGKGWEEGLEPKLTKGPDTLLKVCEQLCKQHKLHLLLTAPARGYVKQGLSAMGIPFTHLIVKDYREIAELFWGLDAYLVTSREEGGPKGVLEALASGTPLVSTRMGLAEDVATDGKDALLADVDDVDQLSKHLAALIENKELRRKLVERGLERIQLFDWPKIAARYYHEVYAPLLGTQA